MRKIPFTLFLLTVDCRERDPTSQCLVKDTNEFGEVFYETTTLESCKIVLEDLEDTSDKKYFSGCTETPLTSSNFDIECVLADDTQTTCPTTSDGCNEGTKIDGDDGSGNPVPACKYECIISTLPQECESDGPFSNQVKDTLNPTKKIHCFEDSYKTCEFSDKNQNDTNQIDTECNQRPCGYKSGDGYSYELHETNKEITNSFDAGTNTDGNVNDSENPFGCLGTGFTPSGCSCIYNPTVQVTSMTCGVSFYKNKCTAENCVDNKCYKGQPITDYGYDNCSLVNKNLGYCKRDERVELPCGDLLTHDCQKNVAQTAYDCTCTGMTNEKPCPVSLTGTDCKITNIAIEDKMATCSKRTCYNAAYFILNSCPLAYDDKTLWQCFDDFNKIEITQKVDTKNFKATTSAANLDEFDKCLVNNECADGNCECKDTPVSFAKNHCGDYYVHQITSKKISSDEVEEDTKSTMEFTCLSYSKTKIAINDMNSNVDGVSECIELKQPKNSLDNANCPSKGSCDVVQDVGADKAPIFGFYECQCEEKCTYECNGKHYDEKLNATVPNDWDKETDDNIYVTYTCEKDNTIMIICTSIFVPLGVAGIAAGIYFFFFHESSEVAPVETDNELASTRNTEHNQVDDDKEETHSEIGKDN